jgi:hypothetical protein
VPVASGDVVGLRLIRIAEALGLGGREVAALLGNQGEQPATQVATIDWHAAILHGNLSSTSIKLAETQVSVAFHAA